MLIKFFIGVTLTIFVTGTYFIWFSKKNIFNHVVLGLCVVAYIVPAFVIDFEEYTTSDVINLYVIINILGCFFYLCGMFLGYKVKRLVFINSVLQFNFLDKLATNGDGAKKLLKVASAIYVAAVIGIVISYILMGFVPLFAADPFMAKFFKGEYQAPYTRVAFLYRTSRQLIEFLMPLKILEIFMKFSVKNVFLALVGIILIAVSLNRGPILTGVLIAVSIVVALKKSNGPFWMYLLVIFSSFIIGSSVYYIIGLIFPNSFFGAAADNVSFFEAIALGAPDITDQLTFLNAFLNSGNHYTYGLTFIGGLIPFNFPWNPSVYTLSVLNDTSDISDIASGGLRLPVSIWGYVSFGWIGVAAIPFFSGFFTGYIIKKVKRIVSKLSENENGYITFFFLQFVFSNIGTIFTGFYTLSIYVLPAFFLYYILLKQSKKGLAI